MNLYFNTGPAIGALLYDIGGFSLPFLICGSINIVFAVLLILTIRSQKVKTSQETKEREDFNRNSEKNHLLKESSRNNVVECNDDYTADKTNLGYFYDLNTLCGIKMNLIALNN